MATKYQNPQPRQQAFWASNLLKLIQRIPIFLLHPLAIKEDSLSNGDPPLLPALLSTCLCKELYSTRQAILDTFFLYIHRPEVSKTPRKTTHHLRRDRRKLSRNPGRQINELHIPILLFLVSRFPTKIPRSGSEVKVVFRSECPTLQRLPQTATCNRPNRLIITTQSILQPPEPLFGFGKGSRKSDKKQ